MKYNYYSPNKEVAKLFYNANDHEWQHKLDHIDGASFTSYIKNDNVFPAIDKIFGSFKIKTVWYNLIILIMQGVFLNIAVIFRLRKL